ncbi:zinc ribbon domain-containing protein [Thalassotalea sp. G20_0]|uniref:zinc ribbon domain-containing protein n=1 Tax=Thalassotalea sp. G20_0 TaxID=2821093 RepID=UPI00336A47C6
MTKLEYKAKQTGKHQVKIDQWFPSSKTCSCCGQKRNEMPLKVRSWFCSCGAIHDRDINAAGNIRQQGILKLKAEGQSILGQPPGPPGRVVSPSSLPPFFNISFSRPGWFHYV